MGDSVLAAIPGSVADLRAVCANGDQAPYLEWSQRNAALVERVRSGEVECCGECRRDGYTGWCSLLALPVWFTDEGPVYACPRADIDREIGEWFVDLLDEIEAICEGDINVW